MDKAKQGGAASAVATGLRGVVAAASSIGDVNGEKGELIYQGVNIHDLATKSTFEEVVFLLWNGRLPKPQAFWACSFNYFAERLMALWRFFARLIGAYLRIRKARLPRLFSGITAKP